MGRAGRRDDGRDQAESVHDPCRVACGSGLQGGRPTRPAPFVCAARGVNRHGHDRRDGDVDGEGMAVVAGSHHGVVVEADIGPVVRLDGIGDDLACRRDDA
jgi:hypothetical protein